jgi:phosphinothricin acetyltransferase
MEIQAVRPADAAEIAGIYNFYILNSHSTFETEPVDSCEIQARITAAVDDGYPYLVCRRDGVVLGYAYAHRFRPRKAYDRTVEVSVYVRDGSAGSGIGSQLYAVLLEKLRSGGFHTVVAGISLPNEASIRLHDKFGFEPVARFREVGFKFGEWLDVSYYQLFLSLK